MDIFDQQGRKIRLTEKNFLTDFGAEGILYADKNTVYKIYKDIQKIIPLEKIEELKQLNKANLFNPRGSIYNDRQRRIGFSMNRVCDPLPLAKVFTSSFWHSNAITPQIMFDLVQQMQQTIRFIHSKNFLQVDGNEMNYLSNSNLTEVSFIDVDSYQTRHFPATAIMPSIRDYTQSEFNESTDWFSFAIISFQMMVGIHPFRGRSADFKKGDFEGRIKAGVSVLGDQVSYPSSVRDFSIIPKSYRDWYKALFEQGRRIEPPDGKVQITTALKKRVIKEGTHIAIREIAHYKEAIRQFNMVNGQPLVVAGSTLYVANIEYQIPVSTKGIIMRDNGQPLFLEIIKGRLFILHSTAGRIDSGLLATQVFVVANIAYLWHGKDIIELKIMDRADRLIIAPGTVRQVLANATTIFNGVIYQNIMGKAHLMLPVASGIMPLVRIAELDSLNIIDGRYEKGVVVFYLVNQKGDYQQARIRFTEDFSAYDIEFREDIDEPLNFTVLDKGIVAYIANDGLMEISSSMAFSNTLRRVEDKQIASIMKLSSDGDRMLFFSEKKLYQMLLKDP